MTPTAAHRTSRFKSRGFSLLELLTAMMIIAVLATLGFSQYRKHAAQARYLQAQDTLRIVAEGLDQYWLKHGYYPDLGSFDAMIDSNSVLAKENLIKMGMSAQDPFNQPFEGKSSKASYELKCLGDPANQEDAGPITRTPGQGQVLGNGPSTGGAPKSEAPAADAGAKK
jgi:prepilin-type N-terminal cleavage/methylation domain-containing protein